MFIHRMILLAAFLVPLVSVVGGTPSWTNQTGSSSMVVYARVKNPAGDFRENTNNILAAFSGTNTVGVANITFTSDPKVYQLQIFGDNNTTNITFRFYDAELDRVLNLASSTTYVADTNIDSLANPGIYQVPQATQTQTISSFATIPGKTFGDASFVITPPTASSSLPVSVTVKSGPATISGNTVALTGAGTVVLAANQSGNANFTAASEIITSFTVVKSAQSINAFMTVPSQTFSNGASVMITLPTASSSLPVSVTVKSGPATILGNMVTLTGTGTVILAANQGGNANYSAATEVTRTVTVNKGAQSISFTQPAVQNFAPNATFELIGGAPGGAVTFTSSNPNVISVIGNTATIRAVGTAVITAKQPGSANYTAAIAVARTVTVTKGSQSINFTQPAAQTFVPNRTFSLNASAPGGIVTFSSSNTNVISVIGSTATLRRAGTADITAKQAGSANYAPALTEARTVTVNKGSQTITFTQPAAQTYIPNGTFALSGSAPGGAVTFTSSDVNVVSIVGAKATIKGAGTANITANQSGSSNYEAAPEVIRTVTVNKRAQSITFTQPAVQTFAPNGTFALRGSAPGGAVTFTSSNTNVVSIVGNIATKIGAGTAVISANQSGGANYNPATAVTRTVTMNKAAQGITFTQPATQPFVLNGTFALAGSAPGGDVTFTSSNANILSISGTTATMKARGRVTVTVSQAGSANYRSAKPVVRVITLK